MLRGCSGSSFRKLGEIGLAESKDTGRRDVCFLGGEDISCSVVEWFKVGWLVMPARDSGSRRFSATRLWSFREAIVPQAEKAEAKRDYGDLG